MMAKDNEHDDQDPPATKLCSNCKRDIPSMNYLMHQNHCSRNIVLCSKCEEPVPRSEMSEHNEEYHIEVTCKCGEAVEKWKQEEHDAEHCPQRQVTCEYCEMGMDFKNLAEHKDFCGSRTEPCPKCARYVYFRDKARHEATDCKYPEAKPANKPGPSATATRDLWHHNQLLFQPAKPYRMPLGLREQLSGPPFLPRQEVGGDRSWPDSREVLRNVSDGPAGDRKHRKNQDRVQNVMLRNPAKSREKNEERALLQSATHQVDADRLLAQHLAQDLPYDASFGTDLSTNSSLAPPYDDYQDDLAIQDLIKNSYGVPNINTFQEQSSALGDLTLPCEFCLQPIPAESLIQHQSGCRPDLTSHPREEKVEANNSRRRGPSQLLPPSEVLNNLSYGPAPSGYSPVVQSDSAPPYDTDDTLMLPCEFCEELLPADALPMHQVNCIENRTMTPSPAGPGSLPSRRDKPSDSPIRPSPQRVPRPRDFPTRPKKPQQAPVFPGPSMDDDNGTDVDTIPVQRSKSGNHAPQPKSRQFGNPVLAPPFPSDASQQQQGTGQQAQVPFARSSSEKYLHGTNGVPRPTAAVASLPTRGAVQKPKSKNTAVGGQARRREDHPQSKSFARMPVILPVFPDSPDVYCDDEELDKLLGTKVHPRQGGEMNNSPHYKPKKTNLPLSSGLESDDSPAVGSESGPFCYRERLAQQRRGPGARQKVRKPPGSYPGNGYVPSFPNRANPRKGRDFDRRDNSSGTQRSKQPSAPTTMTFEPDGLTSSLQVREDSSAHPRTSKQKQGQGRRTNAQKATRPRDDPML
ncbi:TRAF-type zinc finger domain-containing protein 1-like [Acanthaster planci]|uniref:TRAF-type zinc finger domain-containing protein 1-like n=1 Tax=Acanthaster planci TaxID=133434 RepID=A0A8B7YSC3_ACAPL|nr:TRAF-type zinc finger domain-containing protein 1-like [Acanthaster planci]XP_022096188.1 TRAF-type zinc finger domain-containing protein 1-like [Acanthaster planci]